MKKTKKQSVATTQAVVASEPTHPIHKWVEVEVTGSDGVVKKEQRYYHANGGYMVKPEKGRKVTKTRKIPELDVLLGDILAEEKNGQSAAKLILGALRKKAIAGDVRAAELLLDRAYGKAKQEINVNKNVKQMVVIAGQKIEF